MTLRRITLQLCLAIPVFAAATIFNPAVLAQNATTSLRGTIKDPSGAVVPGATITLTDKASGQTLSSIAGAGGDYQLQQIPPATYTITVASGGFATQSKIAQLLVNQPATINFALSLQSNNEVIDVSATAATLNTNDASLGDAKNNELVQSLPSETRNPADLLSLEPGVFALPTTVSAAATQDSRSGATNGGRSDQGNITLDGVDDNDQVRGLAFFPVLRETQDSLEEFRTTTGLANADAGRSSGAQVSLVTKSGTNRYHGAAYEYFRPSNTVSNDFFNKNAQITEGADNRPAKLIRNIFGADVGGFIHKDKLFFFGNFEGQRQAESQIVVQTSPTAAYQAGMLTYPDASGGTTVLSAAQVATLDAGCQVCNGKGANNFNGYMAPPGPNPNALAYFKSIPAANGSSEGDTYNEGSYTFASPNPVHLNTSIVRLDYIPTDKHRIFVRGNLQKDSVGGVEQFPGQGPASNLIDNSKGLTFGDTWTISPSMVNDIRYAYVRQGYGQSGVGVGDYVSFRFLSTATSENRSTVVSVPVNNIVDNFSFSRGKHTFEAGANWRQVHQNRASDSNSFNSASSNPYWLGGTPPGIGNVASGFGTSYEIAYDNLVGTVPDVTDVYNYKVTSSTAGTLLADGAPISRHFSANEYEGYVQDQWRATPKLTITLGLRYTLLETPYETKGQQVTPTIDTHAWFTERETAALQGQIYEPDLQFAPSGKYYKKPGFYPENKKNFAPRFALAFAPNSKTSVRAGAGIYFDHFGEGLINTFDQNGSFGISSSVSNPAGHFTSENSPRFTGVHDLPFNNGTAPANTTFPYTAPQGNFAITWGLDDHLKTPYSENLDLSMQRELGAGFTLEVAYVGRLGRHLLQQQDLTEPVDYTDPQGGGDYYSAGTQLSKDVDLNADACPNYCSNVASPSIAAIPYFEHVFSYMAGFDYAGESATQAIYNNEWAPFRSGLGATTALADLDFFCGNEFTGQPYNCGPQSRFWQDQFSSLYALTTIGMSYYNAAQITLRHPSRHGFQADINYTFSHSIDMGSDAERTSEFSNGVAGAFSEILNTWKPYLNRASSDFDTHHLITVDSVYELPFGKGKAFVDTDSHIVNALISGWRLSGIFRATSGLPFSFFEPGWTTDWQIESYGVNTSGVKAKKSLNAFGLPQYFANAGTINSGVVTGTPYRLPYPGEAGERNNLRGDGYLNLDTGLSKAWRLRELGNLRFTWEVYNATNTVRFDPASIGASLTGGNLGVASSELTQPRRMQFSLRYDF